LRFGLPGFYPTLEHGAANPANPKAHSFVHPKEKMMIMMMTEQTVHPHHLLTTTAGLLRSKYRNMPMGDCIIAATAIANHARILSDDLHFDTINETKRTYI